VCVYAWEGGGGMRMRMYWCVNKYVCVYMYGEGGTGMYVLMEGGEVCVCVLVGV
jgi:hypothetical protein